MLYNKCAGLSALSLILLFSLIFSIFLVCASNNDAVAAIQCYDCHGTRTTVDNRPEDASFRNVSTGGFPGNHQRHLAYGATPNSCQKCHPGSAGYVSSHRDGRIKISGNINSSPLVTTYHNSTSAFPQTATPTLASCNSVNCHFEYGTPDWGSDPQNTNCSTCHASPPSDGSHPGLTGSGKKHGDYLGTGTGSCIKCHANNTTFAHATSAGKRGLVVRFTAAPNSGGSYSSDVSYPKYLPSQSPARNGTCSGIYCHSDGRGGPALITPQWSGADPLPCYGCHRGRTTDSSQANCNSSVVQGIWSSSSSKCVPDLTMSSNGHHRLVGPQWIRKYPCYYCHNNTVDTSGTIKNTAVHDNGGKDVKIAPQWNILGRYSASYNPSTKVCSDVYCHSDGTTDPEAVRPFAWTEPKTECNSCHGHPAGTCSTDTCHDGKIHPDGRLWAIKTGYPPGSEWMGAMPMFPNQGAGTARANSHPRHSQTNFTCDNCHAATVINGSCTTCHAGGIPAGGMGEVAHINPTYHVNKNKDVVFKDGGSYDALGKTCSGTTCHSGTIDPVWGGSVNGAVTCLGCHGGTTDVDDFGSFNGVQAKINMGQWYTSGHGRYSSSGNYPESGNPAANFPGNPCWYCHDNNVLHKDAANPYRLRHHTQYEQRFEKECVYCHMQGLDSECLACHNAAESLAPQLASTAVVTLHGGTPMSGCRNGGCHDTDATLHKTDSVRFWSSSEKADVKNQYVMMGVCLQCHDDDSGGQCTSCHTAPVDNPLKYSLGFDPKVEGSRFVKPKKARASSSHFGYKHYRAYQTDGTWMGGKFCWDCHDPHGDSNIFMIQGKVATTTDGTFGIPLTRADVVFSQKRSGTDYVRIKDPQNPDLPINGICNVCHVPTGKHYTRNGGDSHNLGRVCTTCHEHRFADSHANKQSCDSCHSNKKPVPKHTAFGLPRDCTKCHNGTINQRMDVMGQLKSNSHHIQGTEVNNRHCYACHWEATPEGLIDVRHHEGYNFKQYTSVKNAKVDLVVWRPGTSSTIGVRPTYYNSTTSIQFLAANMGTAGERNEVSKVSNHCLGCHSDQNNDNAPFENDCRTPRQYAWDRQSVASRYSQPGTTTWGKYNSNTYPAANKKDTIVKAFSAHGNAAGNKGGWSAASGYDAAIPITRGAAGTQNVQCFDCHNSHGSKAVGTTSSYVTFNGTRNGANLKETQKGKGGYNVTYKASANTAGVNPYNTGAGQCFDCHETASGGITTPWGYASTFGAAAPVMGYQDTPHFGAGSKGSVARYDYRDSRKTIVSSHLKAQTFLNYSAQGTINGLCTPCHDPHGVSKTLGANQEYAVPLLKGTWMTSPYQEDKPESRPSGSTGIYAQPPWRTDRNTFSNMYDNSKRIRESADKFAGLCLQCHRQEKLTDGVNKNTPFKSLDRVHESVQGWGANDEHSYPCSKCHQPHSSGLPRLLQTDCLNVNHRGNVASGGYPNQSGWRAGRVYGFPMGTYAYNYGFRCHTDTYNKDDKYWPPNAAGARWNNVSPW
ncbi:MAG: CxxxxCH/CxxCH domain-containing protein [Desulfobacteraceae bacterium]|nr:CxxxxCH/CxxCH domain-containing protein [Desulfobacteraceae bacterium]